jgi:multidrug efflux pump subunit AcrB
MLMSLDDAIPAADRAPVSPEATKLAIKVQADDAILQHAPIKETAETENSLAPRSAPGFFGRVARSVVRVAIIASLCAMAWVGGTYYSTANLPHNFFKGSSSAEVQQSPSHDELAASVQQMAEELRALKASVDSRSAAPGPAGTSAGGQNGQMGLIQGKTDAAIAALGGRMDKLEADFTTQLAQIDGKLAGIEQKISTQRAALAARASATHKHAHLHDAFNPSQDPGAPGAPHPLGGF